MEILSEYFFFFPENIAAPTRKSAPDARPLLSSAMPTRLQEMLGKYDLKEFSSVLTRPRSLGITAQHYDEFFDGLEIFIQNDPRLLTPDHLALLEDAGVHAGSIARGWLHIQQAIGQDHASYSLPVYKRILLEAGEQASSLGNALAMNYRSCRLELMNNHSFISALRALPAHLRPSFVIALTYFYSYATDFDDKYIFLLKNYSRNFADFAWLASALREKSPALARYEYFELMVAHPQSLPFIRELLSCSDAAAFWVDSFDLIIKSGENAQRTYELLLKLSFFEHDRCVAECFVAFPEHYERLKKMLLHIDIGLAHQRALSIKELDSSQVASFCDAVATISNFFRPVVAEKFFSIFKNAGDKAHFVAAWVTTFPALLKFNTELDFYCHVIERKLSLIATGSLNKHSLLKQYTDELNAEDVKNYTRFTMETLYALNNIENLPLLSAELLSENIENAALVSRPVLRLINPKDLQSQSSVRTRHLSI